MLADDFEDRLALLAPKRLLDGLPRKCTVVLLTPSGMPWKADHFRHAWAAASKEAGITDLHFDDLRGTTVTILSEQGANPQEIATITGHSLTTVDAILDKYSGRTLPLAEMAMVKLEKGLAGTTVHLRGRPRPRLRLADSELVSGQELVVECAHLHLSAGIQKDSAPGSPCVT